MVEIGLASVGINRLISVGLPGTPEIDGSAVQCEGAANAIAAKRRRLAFALRRARAA